MSQDESLQDLWGPNPPLVQLLEEEGSNSSGFLGGEVDTAAVGEKKGLAGLWRTVTPTITGRTLQLPLLWDPSPLDGAVPRLAKCT